MGLFLGVIGILLSLAIAGWEYWRAEKAEHRLRETLTNLPVQLVADLSRLFLNPESPEALTKKEFAPKQSVLISRVADINGDGEDELLVSYVSGLHNTAIQVYGKKTPWDFGLLGEIVADTPTDFDLEDVDADGIPEITIVEVAKAPNLPYVMGLRDRVSYKLTDNGFIEVKRVNCYSAEDLEQAMAARNREM